MKPSIPTLLAAGLFAGFVTPLSAETGIRHVNQGRAGHVATPQKYTPRTLQKGEGTTVALTMEKPGKPVTRVQTLGRAGYRLAAQPPRRH